MTASPISNEQRLARAKSATAAVDRARPPQVTVVVCTYNRAAMLAEALRTLLELETEERFAFEVLVVDNNSTDATQRVVAELAERTSGALRTVVETERGVVAARNRGLRDARGEWIAYFDDDQLADRRWLLELWLLAQTQKCKCVGGAVELALPEGCTRNLSPMCRMLLSETTGMNEVRPYDRRTGPGTGNVMIHRDVFARIGGFDAAMRDRAEDTELFHRLLDAEYAAWYTPRAIIHHVISDERLRDDYFLAIANKMGSNLAYLERDAWGGWLFPGRWLLRAIHAYAWFWPQEILALWRGDAEEMLGMRCRMTLSQSYLSRGWSLMTGATGGTN